MCHDNMMSFHLYTVKFCAEISTFNDENFNSVMYCCSHFLFVTVCMCCAAWIKVVGEFLSDGWMDRWMDGWIGWLVGWLVGWLAGFVIRLVAFISVKLWHCWDVIWQVFGESFLQPDIALFRQNLHALESLNSMHQLYSKVTREVISLHVLCILLII